ncbi:dienelactone hydrolase family protein, partial [Brevundimonas sp.]
GRLAPAADATPEQRAAGAPWPVDVAGDLKGPVLGLYGGQDRGIPLDTVEAMRAALGRAGAAGSEIVVYPASQHGFLADYRAGWDPVAGPDAWARLLAHFTTHLKD